MMAGGDQLRVTDQHASCCLSSRSVRTRTVMGRTVLSTDGRGVPSALLNAHVLCLGYMHLNSGLSRPRPCCRVSLCPSSLFPPGGGMGYRMLGPVRNGSAWHVRRQTAQLWLGSALPRTRRFVAETRKCQSTL